MSDRRNTETDWDWEELEGSGLWKVKEYLHVKYPSTCHPPWNEIQKYVRNFHYGTDSPMGEAGKITTGNQLGVTRKLAPEYFLLFPVHV